MDLDTIEVCWNILEQYVKKSDQQHAVSHLVAELMDSGFPDEDIKQLANISELFANAINEHDIGEDDEYWYEDE